MQKVPTLSSRTGSAIDEKITSALPLLPGAAMLWYQQNMGGHAQRVAQLARALAIQLELPAQEIRLVEQAALLHDIGKAAIPAAILIKPGPLNEQEWEVMRRHVEIGYQMLMRAGGIWARIAPLVLQHHERWDGLGYPNGCAGEEILLGARILAVADSYDAMTESRAYRQPLTMAQARAELEGGAGSQYDPDMVAAMLQVLDDALFLNDTQLSEHRLLHGHQATDAGNVHTLIRMLSPQRTQILAAVHVP